MIIYFEDKNKYKASDVIQRINQKNVYEYYLGESISPSDKVTCPFHADKSPSLGFKMNSSNVLKFRCFGCGANGNIFEFVQRLRGYEFAESVRDIVDTFESTKIDKLVPSPQKINIFQSSVERSKIIPYFKPLTLQDFEYWNSFLISLPTLRIFNVRACSKAFVITRHSDNPLELNYTNTNPLYSYDFGKGVYKLYRPLSPEKQYKFVSNTNSHDIQGMSQLPKSGELLIITSSLKDVMVLYELGFNAIAPQSENTVIPEDIISELKSRFKRILIFYDSDKAGYESASKLAKNFDLETIFIPKEYELKDISDYCKIYGTEITSNLVLNLVNG